MNTLVHYLVSPFQEYQFMRHALAACLALALGCGPVGMLLVLRRMSLMGDALSHAVLPGVALGFMVSGLSLYSMSIGGVVAGLLVALVAGVVSRYTTLREDASFAALYLMSLATGVLIISVRGTNVDLIHVLFGTILAVDDSALILIASISTLTIFILSVIYRPLLTECFDPDFLRSVGGHGDLMHYIFLVLVVFNLVAGFTALGTLMAVGLLMLPAASAHFWGRQFWSASLIAIGIALFSGYCGLLLSFYADLPSGPAIILVAGGCYLFSVLCGRRGGLFRRLYKRPHLTG